jgi:hypothetical protein
VGLTTAVAARLPGGDHGDVVCELPMYTRNYVQEGGGIQLGKSDRRKAGGGAMKWTDVEDIGIALARNFPASIR